MKISEQEKLPQHEREQRMDEKLRELVQFAYENAPVVKERFDKTGIGPSDIRVAKDLTKLPLMDKEELLEQEKRNPPFGGFLTVPVSQVGWVSVSPGPVYELLPGEIATKARAFSAAGFGDNDIVLNTVTYHLTPAGILFDCALRSIGAVVIPAGTGNTEIQVQAMHDLGVTAYVGTPSFLMVLVERAEEQGYRFKRDFELQRALVTAEMLPESMRKKFADDYGIEVMQDLGIAEVGSVAYECTQKSGMHVHDEIIAEIIDPKTGEQLGPEEVGELVLTSMKKDFPLIRYRTGDLSAYTDEPCPCGRTSPRLLGILGRVGAAIKVRGMFLHPKEVERAVLQVPQTTRFQAIVSRAGSRDKLKLRVEIEKSGLKISKESMEEQLKAKVKDSCRLKVDEVEFVPVGTILAEEENRIIDERSW